MTNKMIFPKIKVPVLQNIVFLTEEDAINSEFGYIQIEQNQENGIFENILFDDDKLIYDHNYDNEQSNSLIFQNHLQNVIEVIQPYLIGKKVIEVGCGKGHFFKKLSELNIDIYGCDPTYEGDDARIYKKFFSKELNLNGDLIILRHVLEHIKNPIEFISYISNCNQNKGLIYIEVPDFNWIVKNQTYFDLFYEHVNYFRPCDFQIMFNKIIKHGNFFNGQYQYIIADLANFIKPSKFIKSKETINISLDKLVKLVNELINYRDKNIYIWGAASKGVIANLHLSNNNIKVSALIDINPNKQNRYSALTGTKIISPKEFKLIGQNAILLIANPNYEKEIKAELNNINNIYFINL
jgi:2-polyprenyl-3-methyl-5-hydroxy-6-metoxy-1,4-benzoquinol methylase